MQCQRAHQPCAATCGSWPMARVFLETTSSDKCQWMELGCGRAVVRRHSCQPPCWSVPLGHTTGAAAWPRRCCNDVLSSYMRQPPGHIGALKLVGSMDGQKTASSRECSVFPAPLSKNMIRVGTEHKKKRILGVCFGHFWGIFRVFVFNLFKRN